MKHSLSLHRVRRDAVDAAYQTATAVLEENKALLLQSARTLLAKESLTEAELAPIFKSLRTRPPTDAA